MKDVMLRCTERGSQLTGYDRYRFSCSCLHLVCMQTKFPNGVRHDLISHEETRGKREKERERERESECCE